MCSKKIITVELEDDAAAAFEMLLADCVNADPGAQWTPEDFARSMIVSVLEDDLAMHHRPARVN